MAICAGNETLKFQRVDRGREGTTKVVTDQVAWWQAVAYPVLPASLRRTGERYIRPEGDPMPSESTLPFDRHA
jgi:hypothetical protein